MTLRAICSSLTYAGSSIIAAFSKVGNSISSALKSARELVQSVWNRVFPKTENQVPAHSLAGRVTLPRSQELDQRPVVQSREINESSTRKMINLMLILEH